MNEKIHFFKYLKEKYGEIIMTSINIDSKKSNGLYIPSFLMKAILRSPWKVKFIIHKLLPRMVVIPLFDSKILLDLNEEGISV